MDIQTEILDLKCKYGSLVSRKWWLYTTLHEIMKHIRLEFRGHLVTKYAVFENNTVQGKLLPLCY